MNPSMSQPLKLTFEEYLAWERQQIERHEFFDGEVFSQAGETRRHSLIGSNVLRAVGNLLSESECEAHGSDMRILIEATGYVAYPDVSVICPPVEGPSDDVISNPVLLVEVLSPSTSDFDRGGKFDHCQQIPSLREYLIFWQDEPRVEQRTRTDDGEWLLRNFAGLEQRFDLQSISGSLTLGDAYDKVRFDDDA